MDYTVRVFQQENIHDACQLFIEKYEKERAILPLLPSRVIDEPTWIAHMLAKHLAQEPGVAVFHQGRLAGYMVSGFRFPFKGQQAAMIPEYGHASLEKDQAELYSLLYMGLAEKWAATGVQLHLIRHLAGDAVLQEILFQLGFGAVVAERLRDLSSVEDVSVVEIVREQDSTRLIELHREHMRYYRASPIFLEKDADRPSAVADLEEHAGKDDFLVYYEDREPAAYFIVGEAGDSHEGVLLRQTNTAQIKSAYAKPGMRHRGIGKALLRRAVEWAAAGGYDRLFVEHETANHYGGPFWRRHFQPYLYGSMRYIEKT
ncbi:MAG: GNAT family N-acetyltransferase [Candidatus Latescibacteria bacterium]|nr:GNAT family N-acetyltransferase [Candidatus Latescibacterota bacterium]